MTDPASSRPPPDPALVAERLSRRLGPPDKPRLDPLDELVLTILSQSTTDRNRDRAWDRLRARYATWGAVVDAPLAEVEETIRVAGLAGQKARTIRTALVRLDRERGTPTLDHLEGMSDADAIDYLTSFDGVGVKTAACVLCFSLRRPVLPVDTHVHRIARRLGWIPPKASAARAHGLLAERIPPDVRFAMHMWMIGLGRETCRARAPRCATCVLADVCPSAETEPAG